MLTQDHSCPWNVPVPTEAARFVAMVSDHADLNIQVAPNPVYGCHDASRPSDSLLFADVQTNLYSHVSGRLGSGRAGFFRGWYIKGIGRTPLAANWIRRDVLHNSGHLPASAAIREYVVTRYLESQGHADSIVGCDGVLLAELDPSLSGYQAALYANKPVDEVPAVDHHLQAITVKQGGFARPSNFIWLLHHLTPSYVDGGSSSVSRFCELLAAALTVPGEPVLAPAEITAAALAELLARSVQRICERFQRWFASGIWWGSLTNNFTIDGRFLDLETAAVIAGPCLGRLSTSNDDGRPEAGRESGAVGCELFYFVALTRMFCTELGRVLRRLPHWFREPEREFAADLAAEIERQLLAPDQLLGSRERAIAWIRQTLDDAFGPLCPNDQMLIGSVVDALYDRETGSDPAGDPLTLLAAVPGHAWLVTEPGLRWRPFGFALPSGRLLGPSEQQCRIGRALAELTSDLDHTTSLPVLLDKLAQLPRDRPLV